MQWDSKYALLNNPKWLKQKYLVEELSLPVIQGMVGAKNHNSVREALIYYGFPLRNSRTAQLVRKGNEDFKLNLPVINGSLLGDGFLRTYNKRSNIGCPSFYKRNKYYDHVALVAQAITPSEWKEKIKKEIHQCNGRKCICYLFRTFSHEELLPLYRKWYPEKNGFKKLVPKDLILDRETLLHWFMDDGSTSFRPERKTPQIRITFCSESFSKKDQERLCRQMKQNFGINAKTTPCQWGTGWRIKVPQAQARLFFDVLGPCPVPDLSYKWKVPPSA